MVGQTGGALPLHRSPSSCSVPTAMPSASFQSICGGHWLRGSTLDPAWGQPSVSWARSVPGEYSATIIWATPRTPTDLTAAGVPRPFAAVPGGRGAAPNPGAEPRRAPTHPLPDAASEPLEEIKCKTRTATNVSGCSPLASRGRDHLCLARVSSRCQGFGDMRGSD